MAKRLLSYDPVTKTHTWHDYDHSTKKTIIIESQDVESYLKKNKMEQSMGWNESNKQDYKKIASIPNSVIAKWKQELGLDVFNKDHLPKIEKLLQSSEYKYLRTCNRI